MSRKKRKRYRRKGAEASARVSSHEGAGGTRSLLTRSDWALVRQAANQGWSVPEPMRDAVCLDVFRAAGSADGVPRLCNSVCRAVIAMDEANQRQEHALIRALLRNAGLNHTSPALDSLAAHYRPFFPTDLTQPELARRVAGSAGQSTP